jgi:hypothetical protein
MAELQVQAFEQVSSGSPSTSGGDMADKVYPPPPPGKVLIFRWIDGKVRPLFVDA